MYVPFILSHQSPPPNRSESPNLFVFGNYLLFGLILGGVSKTPDQQDGQVT
jgi:hypothetical protein